MDDEADREFHCKVALRDLLDPTEIRETEFKIGALSCLWHFKGKLADEDAFLKEAMQGLEERILSVRGSMFQVYMHKQQSAAGKWVWHDLIYHNEAAACRELYFCKADTHDDPNGNWRDILRWASYKAVVRTLLDRLDSKTQLLLVIRVESRTKPYRHTGVLGTLLTAEAVKDQVRSVRRRAEKERQEMMAAGIVVKTLWNPKVMLFAKPVRLDSETEQAFAAREDRCRALQNDTKAGTVAQPESVCSFCFTRVPLSGPSFFERLGPLEKKVGGLEGSGGKQQNKFQVCGNCRGASYCSKDCQVAHWKQHKAECFDQQVES